MFWSCLILLADDQTSQPAAGGGLPQMLMMFVPIMILFWFMMIRPARKQEQLRQQLVANMKKNDKVLTAGGIYGNIVSVSDKEDEVILRVDDNARLRITKGSIARNITQEEALKQSKETKSSGA
jgi:preprotein translocase subunit YajC